jgi:putative restriction endonuclease
MANAVLTTSESSAYDDQPEIRYHFPRTYLNQAEQAVGDWILYYEPRRTSGPSSATGRQAYFAAAFVDRLIPDEERPDHFYALLKHYIELDQAVPFRQGDHYFESLLRKEDGSTNKGAFGRSVRVIPRDEFEAVLRAGLSTAPDPWEATTQVQEKPADYPARPLVERLQTRKYRDVAFRRHVRAAYDNTCAITGLRLINGGGRPEVQAAHIWPVEHDGPDTVRNGLALTGTAHWLFDRGLLTVDESFRVCVASTSLPAGLESLISPGQKIRLPAQEHHWPHANFLRWHRENRFKG